jgi:hypothetical protein
MSFIEMLLWLQAEKSVIELIPQSKVFVILEARGGPASSGALWLQI